ncbi:conserved hypothetical protein [Myxococcus xanthus DK 1622]|uniref:Uncharacterized protein n=1 Tax=Myxococcus xanthus (strain DK1622) TaxID=246197 RepID=Q1DAE3_MYXXD|nr:conserved hypothetical protein [Myxococcus xanthus DK 1622]
MPQVRPGPQSACSPQASPIRTVSTGSQSPRTQTCPWGQPLGSSQRIRMSSGQPGATSSTSAGNNESRRSRRITKARATLGGGRLGEHPPTTPEAPCSPTGEHGAVFASYMQVPMTPGALKHWPLLQWLFSAHGKPKAPGLQNPRTAPEKGFTQLHAEGQFELSLQSPCMQKRPLLGR